MRHLVRYTETHPIFVPPPDGAGPEAGGGDVEAADGAAGAAGIRTTVCFAPRMYNCALTVLCIEAASALPVRCIPPPTSSVQGNNNLAVQLHMRNACAQVFPSLNPARREDVVLLQAWLKDTMAQLTAEFGDIGAATVQVGLRSCQSVFFATCCQRVDEAMGLSASRLACVRARQLLHLTKAGLDVTQMTLYMKLAGSSGDGGRGAVAVPAGVRGAAATGRRRVPRARRAVVRLLVIFHLFHIQSYVKLVRWQQ